MENTTEADLKAETYLADHLADVLAMLVDWFPDRESGFMHTIAVRGTQITVRDIIHGAQRRHREERAARPAIF